MEIEPADVTDARADHDVRRIAGEPRPRDAVLHDVEGVDHHARNAGAAGAADELALERMLGAEHGAETAPLRRRFGRRRGLGGFAGHDHAAAENVGAEIDRDDETRAEHARGRHRHRIDQRAVNEPAAVERNRRENSGQRVGGAHRVDQPAARQPDFVAGADLGRDGGEADRQRLDRRVAELLFEPRRELAAADQAAAGRLMSR